jgi:hypothetical protein
MGHRMHRNTANYLLKKVVEGIIRNEIAYRKKLSFGASLSQWIRGDFSPQEEAANLVTRDCSIAACTLYNLTTCYDYCIEGAAP